MNKKAKGNRSEYKTMRLLEAVGYECFRMAASKGAFDVIAVSASDVLLIQVKSNRLPSAFEMETIKAFECPINARKIVHVWQDRKCLPVVREV
jgi:Holliday junction resolvase